MSGPQVVPSAAGMNLVSHRCPVRWHHNDLQMSCRMRHAKNETAIKHGVCWCYYPWHLLVKSSFPFSLPSTWFLPGPPSLCLISPHCLWQTSPQCFCVETNHWTSLMKPAIIVCVIWPNNTETEQVSEHRGRAGVERQAAESGNWPNCNWQREWNQKGGSEEAGQTAPWCVQDLTLCRSTSLT